MDADWPSLAVKQLSSHFWLLRESCSQTRSQVAVMGIMRPLKSFPSYCSVILVNIHFLIESLSNCELFQIYFQSGLALPIIDPDIESLM